MTAWPSVSTVYIPKPPDASRKSIHPAKNAPSIDRSSREIDMMHLRHRHVDELSQTGRTLCVHGEEHVVAWQHDSGVGGQREGIGEAIGRSWV